MVCSACGYENQVGNRYCGMCGIPLPHRPLTTPGAQSTASLTRPLAENAGPVEPRASVSQARTGVASEPISSSDVARPSQDQEMERDTPASEAPPPHVELVPEIPLDEYVQSFRYVPPSDPEESTMRGETSVLRPEELRPEELRPELAASSNTIPATPTETATAATEAAPPASADDVRERLGLEVDSTPEERSDRPRFLDFNQPPTPIRPARTTQSIAGPSFLGLNDPPQVEAATSDELDEFEVEGPARVIWRIARIGLALVVVLVFSWLGVLEWKAQVGQTNNGPVEVIKMKMRSLAPNGSLEIIKAKMRSLAHGMAAEKASPEPASPATSSAAASKPEMKVEPPKPQNQNPAANPATSPQAEDAATAHNTNPATAPPASTAPVATGPA
ncbi:MAG: zinc ribbon domain-containing protein, partial [Candidatus Korobacteraceae bacterium]